MPVDAARQPLCFNDRFKDNPDAMVWLWKDHTGYAEAAQITEMAGRLRPHYLSRIGGTYSSEWWWSKILRCQHVSKRGVRCRLQLDGNLRLDPAVLTGDLAPPRHHAKCFARPDAKAMFSKSWEGIARRREFLNALSPDLGALRPRLYANTYTSEHRAGRLSSSWAKKLGLPSSVWLLWAPLMPIWEPWARAFPRNTRQDRRDEHLRHHGNYPHTEALQDIPGVCGIVDGSVM